MADAHPSPRFPDRRSRHSPFSEDVVERRPLADWPRKKLKPYCLEETEKLYRADFGKLPSLESANPRPSHAAKSHNFLLSFVRSNACRAKFLSKLEEVHAQSIND